MPTEASIRVHAANIVAEERREAGQDVDPMPCAILDEGDDADAIEASLIENTARLDADEVTRWETFTGLVKEGRSVDDLSATFGLPYLAVKRILALGNPARWWSRWPWLPDRSGDGAFRAIPILLFVRRLAMLSPPTFTLEQAHEQTTYGDTIEESVQYRCWTVSLEAVAAEAETAGLTVTVAGDLVLFDRL